MSEVVERDMSRMNVQSNWPDKDMAPGGPPLYSVAELRACLAETPHLSFHCLLAMYCGDRISIEEIKVKSLSMLITEWFDNAKYRGIALKPGQLRKIAELAVRAWLNPRDEKTTSLDARAAYIGSSRETFRTNYLELYSWMIAELNYHLEVGDRSYRTWKYGKRPNG